MERKEEKKSAKYMELSREHGVHIFVGLWISPQQIFFVPLFSRYNVSIFNFSIPIVHLVVSLPLIGLGVLLGITGVRQVGMEVAETHRTPKKLETGGVYSIVRHPQYLAWILSHIGLSIFLSASYSLLFTPMLILVIYLISRKEEEELIREFGEEYRNYQKRVNRFIPKF